MSTPSSADVTTPPDEGVLLRLRAAQQPLGLPDDSIPTPEELLRDAQFSRRSRLPPPPAAWRLLGVAWAASLAARLVMLVGAAALLARGTELVESSPLPQLRLVSVVLLVSLAALVLAGATAVVLTRTQLLAADAARQLRGAMTPARLLRVNLVSVGLLTLAGLAALSVEEAVRHGLGLPSEVRLQIARGVAVAILVSTGVEVAGLALARLVRVVRGGVRETSAFLPRGQRLLARTGALSSTLTLALLLGLVGFPLYQNVWGEVEIPPEPAVSDVLTRAQSELFERPHFWELRTGTVEASTLSTLPAGVVADDLPDPFGAAALVDPARLRLAQRFAYDGGGGQVQDFAAARATRAGALRPRLALPGGEVSGFVTVSPEDPLGDLSRVVGPLERIAALRPLASAQGAASLAPRGCDVYAAVRDPRKVTNLRLRRLSGEDALSGEEPLEPRLAFEVVESSDERVPRASIRFCVDEEGFPVLVEQRQLQGSQLLVSQLRPVRGADLPVLPERAAAPLPPVLGELVAPPSRLGETLTRILRD